MPLNKVNNLPEIDILLATYNGQKYLGDQLYSIKSQIYKDWHLIIRDDCSTDNTLEVIENFIAQNNISAEILNSAEKKLGPKDNFARLLRASKAPYFMLCDQDDIWHSDKLNVLLQAMQNLEQKHGHSTPMLIHSDLRVIDENSKIISDSFWHYQKLGTVPHCSFNALLVQNRVTGCSLIGNRALKELAVKIPPEAIMHDWWLALIAAGMGHIGSVQEALTDYRSHLANFEGPKDYSWKTRWDLRQPIDYYRNKLARHREQAIAFKKIYGAEINSFWQPYLAKFIDMHETGFLGRRFSIAKNGFWMSSLLRNIVYLAIA